MANTVSTQTYKQLWERTLARQLEKSLVSYRIANTITDAVKQIHNPYQSRPTATDQSLTGTYAVANFTTTNDTINVDKEAIVGEHVYKHEELLSRYDLATQRAKEHAYVIKEKIDAVAFQTIATTSGTLQVDDGELGGIDGNPITLSATNVDNMFRATMEALLAANVPVDRGLFIVLAPDHLTKLAEFQQTNGFSMADAALRNGFVTKFGGFDVFVSNQLYNDGTQDHAIAGTYGAFQLVLPRGGASFEAKPVSGKTGREIVSQQIYGMGVWNYDKVKLVDILVN